MGTSTILDLLGSFFIGGILLIMLANMNASATENLYLNSGELMVQRNLVALAETLEYDFRKIGYCSNLYDVNTRNSVNVIVYADTSRIDYYSDYDKDGTSDLISFRLGDKTDSDASKTPNPNDRILYKFINNVMQPPVNLGVIKFKLSYYSALDVKIDESTLPITSPPTGIIYIQIDLAVENSYAYGNEYTKDRIAFWRQIRVSSVNLNR